MILTRGEKVLSRNHFIDARTEFAGDDTELDLIGYLVLNPDIMSDIKMAIPFCPAATVLF